MNFILTCFLVSREGSPLGLSHRYTLKCEHPNSSSQQIEGKNHSSRVPRQRMNWIPLPSLTPARPFKRQHDKFIVKYKWPQLPALGAPSLSVRFKSQKLWPEEKRCLMSSTMERRRNKLNWTLSKYFCLINTCFFF